ncbi:STAS domain-containing protein [Desulfosediminicola flagellatus]|uniref:STAS domain-containing protein n=1 Tax=Desulfosediminicola flagellatus TaxID=2569541 RepID=UPI0010ADA2A9|nr:STAS domain-containing protein [Desulfosediminicola flagellatus]
MDYSVARQEDTVIVKPIGRLDSVTSPEFEKNMAQYLKTPGSNLLLDFDELDYISSAGLRVVLNAAKVFREVEFQFAACNMQDHVREVFEISGFDSFITIYDSVSDFLNRGA